MKRLIFLLALLLCVLGLMPCAYAQQITMESVYAGMEFPDTWLVVSPQLLPVYEPYLLAHGLDTQEMAERYAREGIIAEAWDADFAQSMRVLVTTDTRSETIFDMDRATTAERSSLLRYYETRSNFTATPYRYQQAEWQTHSQYGRFLFLRYNTLNASGDIAERGVRYLTIKNGQNYIIDWTIPDRRFTNRDLNIFRQTLESFTFTTVLDAPPRPAVLSAQIPAEVSDARVELTGTATAQAGLIVTLSAGEGEGDVVSVGSANDNGAFSIFFDLPGEGTYHVTLTASRTGYADTSIRQTLTYQASLLPVSIDAWPDDPWTQDTFTLSGETLPGSQLQLLSDKGLVTKRPNASGRFSFELNTPDAGEHQYTLVVTNGRYTQRRFPFTVNRAYTDEQVLDAIKRTAVSISYRNLQQSPGEYAGQVMRLSGYVSEITQGEGICFIRLMLSRGTQDVWTTPVLIACEQAPDGLVQGERAVVYGYVADPYYERGTEESADTVVPGFTFICVD